ncbi:TolC family protein [Achromobacter marplatensis]|uniref:TolC family protein n=1 Tax=Achromobacter marplatensis TaxID=470868 RepID=UPI0028ECB593|nr:TolC family protein [Achromobacter marplatensis]
MTDEQLRKLIDLAIANNQDLRQAILNVEAARDPCQGQRADRLPGLDAQGSGSGQRNPADLPTMGRPTARRNGVPEQG